MFSFTKELTGDFRELIDRIKPEFEENLIRVSYCIYTCIFLTLNF